MQFGLFCSPKAAAPGFAAETGQGFRDFLEYNIEAEALGFASSFSVEHHFSGWNQSSATLMLLMALAMRTSTLRLGTAVLVLPWHNPVLLAEQAATLDLLSNGRFDFGIGKGYRHGEFKGFAMPQEEADARFDESVEVMTRGLHESRALLASRAVLEFRGHRRRAAADAETASAVLGRRRQSAVHPSRRRARLQPDPRSICVAGGTRRAHRHLQGGARAGGLRFEPAQVTVARQLYVAKDDADRDAALERQRAYTSRIVESARAPDGKPGSHVLAYADKAGRTEENALYGTPDEIARMLEELRAAGVVSVLLTVAGGVEQLRRFAREIMPAFADTSSARAAE